METRAVLTHLLDTGIQNFVKTREACQEGQTGIKAQHILPGRQSELCHMVARLTRRGRVTYALTGYLIGLHRKGCFPQQGAFVRRYRVAILLE